MQSPYTERNTKVAEIMHAWSLDEAEARVMLRRLDAAYAAGVFAGRAEAQQFFRHALGIEAPSNDVAAYWNNPVPLKETE